MNQNNASQNKNINYFSYQSIFFTLTKLYVIYYLSSFKKRAYQVANCNFYMSSFLSARKVIVALYRTHMENIWTNCMHLILILSACTCIYMYNIHKDDLFVSLTFCCRYIIMYNLEWNLTDYFSVCSNEFVSICGNRKKWAKI